MKNKKTKAPVNYAKIKRNLVLRDTNGDRRFVTRAVTEAKHKPDKHKHKLVESE